jgi:acetyl-CoA C-acetyltransferase
MPSRRAAIAGFTEWAPQRRWAEPMFTLEAFSRLTREACDDAGIEPGEIDGVLSHGVAESPLFGPAAVVEYLGIAANFAEVVDLGGATAAGLVWRAVAAVEAGACDTCICLTATVPAPATAAAPWNPSRAYMGADSWGAPHGQFDLPYGLNNPNSHFALIAQRYMHEFNVPAEALAKVAVDQRTNALANPMAVFRQPITVEDVLNSPYIVDPLHQLEIVMPCSGAAAIIVTTEERARRGRNRPVLLTGFGERITHKAVTYAPSLVRNPIVAAADRAFTMAGVERTAIDLASMYDCYTVTVLLTIEGSGFCAPGQGGRFVTEHDLTYRGDWPLNTHGGQLSMGQGGIAGGTSHITEAIRQLQGRAGERQLPHCERAYVTGTGGFMAEQIALILEGA